MSHTKKDVHLTRDVKAIAIPDGTTEQLEKGQFLTLHQELGGSFTVINDYGMMYRINGIDADAIGEEIPESAKAVDPHSKTPLNEQVWEQLRTIYDPEIPVNIVDLGLVYDCQILPIEGMPGHHKIEMEMTLTAPGCGMGQVLQNDVHERLKKIPAIKLVNVELVFDPPWDRDMMTEEARLQLGLL